MNRVKKLRWFWRRQRARYRRLKRLLFASPAEMQLITLMGGKVLTTNLIRNRRTGFPLTLVLDIGSWFGKEHMRREVRIGRYWTDFGNDLCRAIEVDGDQFHMDIVKEQQRDDYFQRLGWRILHVRAGDILANPDAVQRQVINFLLH